MLFQTVCVVCWGRKDPGVLLRHTTMGSKSQHTPVSILHSACRGQYEPASVCRAHWTFRRPLIKGVLEYAIFKYRVPPVKLKEKSECSLERKSLARLASSVLAFVAMS